MAKCTMCSKVLFGLGGLFAVIAAIMVIAAVVGAAASLAVGFEIENSKTGTIDIVDAQMASFEVFTTVSDASNCQTMSIKVKDPNGASTDADSVCGSFAGTKPDHDPPLKQVARFDPKYSRNANDGSSTILPGTYTVTSNYNIWVVDMAEEMGEAVGGIFGAYLSIVAAVGVFIVGMILLCVGCCCLGSEPAGGQQQGGVVVGRQA